LVLWASLALRTGLVQITGKADSSLVRDAGYRAQVFVDGPDVIVRHVTVDRPRHDHKKTGVEGRRRDATQHPHRRACGMREIKVVARPENRKKLVERVPAFGKRVGTRSTVAPWRQIPAVDIQPWGRSRRDEFSCSWKWAEGRAAAQVGRRIDLRRGREGYKVRVVARYEADGVRR
jgi:hypothetical protein